MKKQGSALILTLLVVATLTGLTVAFSEESSLELNLAGYSRDGDQAYLAARSGVHLALALLNADENKGSSAQKSWRLSSRTMSRHRGGSWMKTGS